MMKQEFEKLAGYEVSDSDYYSIIEPMYIVRDLTEKEKDELKARGVDLTMSTSYDIHYSRCLDTKRKPIEPYR